MTLKYAKKPYSKRQINKLLNPLVSEWLSSFNKLTPPQKYAIPIINNKENTLIASPTGSGKTISAFLNVINDLINLKTENKLEDAVYCIYISPLRSLNNDIRKNLLIPLNNIQEKAQLKNEDLSEIRVGIRTGDTPQNERTKMLRRPPHILITTPETLAIILCAPKFRECLRNVKCVILDEIHEICTSKRGVHLSLSLERLQELANNKLTRIGLSATIHPLDEVAKFLVGQENGIERDCTIVDTRFVKPIEFKVTCPVPDLIHTSYSKINSKLYSSIRNSITNNHTTLIFTNTRSNTERVVHQLERLGSVNVDELAAHHGSLSREMRQEVENKLKEGNMKVVVTSTSLELGVDIGSIDLVTQIGSPKSIARCLQRVGRSGHSLDKVSKGNLIATNRDDLIENAVISLEISKGNLDKVYIPKLSLDVLSQHVVGMGIEQQWNIKDAYELIKRSYCYKDLEQDTFNRIIKYLSGGYQDLEEFRVYGKIWYDEETGMFGRRGPMVRMLYSTNIGTIPNEVSIKVYDNKKKLIGFIEEEFLLRLSKNDIFVLGGKTFQFKYSKGFNAYAIPATNMRPTIPAWHSETLPLSFELGESISQFRGRIFKMIEKKSQINDLVKIIMKETSTDKIAATNIIDYFNEEYKFLKTIGITKVPSPKNIIIENYIDNDDRQNIIFNCVFGRKINDALSRAYATAPVISKKRNVLITVNDNGFILTFSPGVRINPKWIIKQVKASNLRRITLEAIKRTELVKRSFRHCAVRSFMVLRTYKGHNIRVGRQQINSQILMEICQELDKFPVLEESYREIIEDKMDIKNAENILSEIENKKRVFVFGPESRIPSPFTHNLILSVYDDVVGITDKKALLENLYEIVNNRINQKNNGKLLK